MAALLERESNGSGAGFKVNEIRSATDDDFQHFMRLVEEYKTEGSGWTKKLERRDITIWQKETGQSSIKMALVSGAGTIDIVLNGNLVYTAFFAHLCRLLGNLKGFHQTQCSMQSWMEATEELGMTMLLRIMKFAG